MSFTIDVVSIKDPAIKARLKPIAEKGGEPEKIDTDEEFSEAAGALSCSGNDTKVESCMRNSLCIVDAAADKAGEELFAKYGEEKSTEESQIVMLIFSGKLSYESLFSYAAYGEDHGSRVRSAALKQLQKVTACIPETQVNAWAELLYRDGKYRKNGDFESQGADLFQFLIGTGKLNMNNLSAIALTQDIPKNDMAMDQYLGRLKAAPASEHEKIAEGYIGYSQGDREVEAPTKRMLVGLIEMDKLSLNTVWALSLNSCDEVKESAEKLLIIRIKSGKLPTAELANLAKGHPSSKVSGAAKKALSELARQAEEQ